MAQIGLALQSATDSNSLQRYSALSFLVKPRRFCRTRIGGTMAGSFDFFRKYQRSLLVFVAILAMLAFFVLPPFLQMGNDYGGDDPTVVTWTGGEFREGGIERAVAMRSIVNRFLMEIAAAAGRDPNQLPLFAESEEEVVRTRLLAAEAKANGMTVSDSAINDFLSQWTNNLVRPEQFDEIIARLRIGPTAVSQHDLFESLRIELAARNLLILFQTGFSGDPPGWRWDYFCRLEQSATVEVVPIIVEQLSTEVEAPSEQTLRAFYEKYKEDLPTARSITPGFREPHRVKYDFLIANAEAYQADAIKAVTAEQVAAYYEKNKTTLFRAQAVTPPVDPPPAEDKPTPEPTTSEKTTSEKPTPEKPTAEKPIPETADPAHSAEPPADDQGAVPTRHPFTKVAFKQPAAAESENKAEPAAAVEEKDKTDPAAVPADPATLKEEPPQFEPLAAVEEKIRTQLAREQANARIDEMFTAVRADLQRYSEDHALWQARRTADTVAPKAPDFDEIAKARGLEAGHSKLVSPDEAVAASPIGGSFEFVPDPGSRFGIRQQSWLDTIYGSGALLLRPITSRDVKGNRYLSIKTEDQPEFTPSFETARETVDRAWRIVASRGLARKRADQLTAEADSKKLSLEETVAKRSDVKVTQVGPFTWLSQNDAAAERPAVLSQPSDLFMPGEEFMRAVFSLEPNQTAVAFNAPQTVCYCIRLLSLAPEISTLKEKFLEDRGQQRRLAMVAQGDISNSFRAWMKGLEDRYRLDWKRQSQVPGR